VVRQIHQQRAWGGAILGALLLLAGCVTKQRLTMYSGTDLPSTKTALVTGQFDTRSLLQPQKSSMMIFLRTVDGTHVPQCGRLCDTEAIVMPGTHTITFDFFTSINRPDDPNQVWRYEATSKTPLAVIFSAAPGHQYEIRASYASNQETPPWSGGEGLWLPSVVDRQTQTSIPLLQSAESSQ